MYILAEYAKNNYSDPKSFGKWISHSETVFQPRSFPTLVGMLYRRALAVKLAFQGYMYEFIGTLLNVSPSFVSKAKKAYESSGVAGFQLQYQGSQPYVSSDERQAVIVWLKAQRDWSVEQLSHHIEATYDVVFQSRQSYYQLLDEAQISYKKAQSRQPKSNPELVAAKKKEIQALLKQHESEIAQGLAVVLYIDECHLIWNDACGYVWGPRNQRIELPIERLRERQTYFGAIDARTGEVTAIPCDKADGRWTTIFVEFLRQQYEGKRLIICWDGASYHRGEEMRTYLESLNLGKPRNAWTIICIQFAPYTPQQNPIENVWLQAKEFIRKNWRKCETFQHVTELFERALHTLSFNFDRLHMYFV